MKTEWQRWHRHRPDSARRAAAIVIYRNRNRPLSTHFGVIAQIGSNIGAALARV